MSVGIEDYNRRNETNHLKSLRCLQKLSRKRHMDIQKWHNNGTIYDEDAMVLFITVDYGLRLDSKGNLLAELWL